MLPDFREVLDCASPLALWLPLQKWVHGPDARPLLEVATLWTSHGRILMRLLDHSNQAEPMRRCFSQEIAAQFSAVFLWRKPAVAIFCEHAADNFLREERSV